MNELPRVRQEEALEAKDIYLPSNVSLNILFSPHVEPEDIGNFREFRRTLRRSDIFIPESIAWNRNVPIFLKQISQGNERLYKLAIAEISKTTHIKEAGQASAFTSIIYEALYDSKKPVALVDLPEGHPLIPIVQPRIEPSELYPTSFEVAIERHAEYIRKSALAQHQRDHIIMQSMGPTLEKIINSDPQLRSKKEINVLMTMGLLHSSIYGSLKSKTDEQRANTGKTLPFVKATIIGTAPDANSVLSIHFHPGHEHTIPEDELKIVKAQALASHILSAFVGKEIRHKIIYETVKRLSLDEMRELYDFAAEAYRTKNAEEPDVLYKIEGIFDELRTTIT